MDFLKELISSKGAGLVSELADLGFSAEQAEKFIPEAGGSIVDAMQGLDLSALLGSGAAEQTSSLLGHIDIAGLASRLGLDTGLATGGLEKLIPVAMDFLKDNPAAAGVLGLLGGKAGGLAGMARGLFR
jgi:hypothetical protein